MNTKNNRRLEVLSLATRPSRLNAACGVRQINDAAHKQFEVSDELLSALRDDVLLRRTERGTAWLENQRGMFLAINSEHRNTAAFIGFLSQWVGTYDHAADSIRQLLSLFPQPARGHLPLSSYIHLRLADGILALADDEPERAAAHFDFIISLEQEPILDKEIPALAHSWKAFCERKRGNWDNAIAHAERARKIALALGYAAAAAVMQALEGCLNIQKGRLPRATELLREAEVVLTQTDDLMWRGNIQSGYGSIALEEGRHELALEYFEKAAVHFEHHNPRHRSLARSLASLAHTQRLLASRIVKTIDTHTETRRKSAETDSCGLPGADAAARQRVERLRGEASSNLARAIELCRALSRYRALALARVEDGLLLLDCGSFDRATVEANEAFELGCLHKDYAVMSHARLLLGRIENAQYEEGIGDAPEQHAQRAHDLAKDALTYARQTDDRRLLANAYLFHGLILCNEYFNNVEAAAEYCRQAGECLTAANRNQLWEDYQTLTSKVARSGSVNARLREWSQGLVEGKTFQQLTEDFADLVIPSVWEREGRNASRVVSKLSISPKKVRRILSRVGLKAATD